MIARGRRIAIVCPYTLTSMGGVQGQAIGLAAWLRSRGEVVTLFAPADGPVGVEDFVSLGRSTTFHDNGSTTRVAMSPRGLVRVASSIRRFDLIHLHEPMHPACLAALSAARAPTVGTFHMAAERQLWYRLFRPVVGTAASRLSRRVAVSRRAARFAGEALPGTYDLIPNAIDTAAFTVSRRTPGGRRVLYVGRPDPRKGLDVLLRAIGRVRPPVELHLAGVDPAAAHGGMRHESRAITCHGPVSHDELRRLLADSDVLVTPSIRSESFGITLIEGMAAGLPIVASAIPAHRDLLPPECGRLVPPGDPAALAYAIDELLGAPETATAMGAAGREEARRYDWDEVGPQILEVYEEELNAA